MPGAQCTRSLACKIKQAYELALQLLLWEMSESMGNHDLEVVDASSVD